MSVLSLFILLSIMKIVNLFYKINTYSSLYICGKSGLGKTSYIIDFLKSRDYNYSYIPIQNLKTEKEWTELFQRRNVLSMFNKVKNKKEIIVIDNIDYLQNNDKKIIGIITKHLKNNENNKESHTIIFIGNNSTDKKVLELQEYVDEVFHIKSDLVFEHHDKHMKEIVSDLINQTYNKHNPVNSEKTIVSLCFHENIVHFLDNDLSIYSKILNNICTGDYFDRIAFQKQLWQFNEMTYFLKVVQNYDMYKLLKKPRKPCNYHDVIFTKILTKYSNEYANSNYIINLCNRFEMQKHEFFKKFKENDECLLRCLSTLEKKRIQKLIS
jgi:Cdc6-like AAA superfamily ATPase